VNTTCHKTDAHQIGDCVAFGETTMTALGQREQEARRIARANGAPIIYADPDWTFFTLDNPMRVGATYPGGPGTIRTHFEWVEGRFEGFVS
jgi:hypothetical protein